MTLSRSSTFVPVLILIAAAIVLTNVFPFRQMLAQQQQVDAARTQLELLQTENARLESEAAALQTDHEIERIARGQLGYVFPDDQPYVVTTPRESPAVAETAAEYDLGEPWYLRIWHFLTGRDLLDG